MKHTTSLRTFVIIVLLVGAYSAATAQTTTSPDFRPTILSSINTFVSQIADRVVPFGEAMAAIGIVTMAFIQTIKDMLPVRRWFQRHFVQKWLMRGAFPSETQLDAVSCEQDLIHLTAADDTAALYDLATEQLCGQINAAAQVLIEYPSRHRGLLDCLARGADRSDIEKLVSPPEFITMERETLSSDQKKEITAVFDARNRVAHHIQRNIDALQISMSFRWKFILQLVSFGVSFVIAFLGVLRIDQGNHFFPAVLIGGMAGFLAPVARDLVAALQQLRKP